VEKLGISTLTDHHQLQAGSERGYKAIHGARFNLIQDADTSGHSTRLSGWTKLARPNGYFLPNPDVRDLVRLATGH
jgi:hypothetical protein